MRIRSLAAYVVSAHALVTVLTSICNGSPPSERVCNWTRDITDGGTLANYPREPLVVLLASSIGGHLSARCGYQYIEDKGSVVLRGKRNTDGQLEPIVTLQVATEGTRKWKNIATSLSPKHPASTIVDPTNSRLALFVDMDPFRPFLEKATWGRVVLENGDVAPIALEDLLPNGGCPWRRNYKRRIDDAEPRRLGSSFELLSVVSLRGRLVGNMIFIGGQAGPYPIQLAGRKAADTHFWPACTFQGGNTGDDWKTLSNTGDEGSLDLLTVYDGSSWKEVRVPLDVYVSIRNKYKLGKIIFSGGQYAVIRIADIAFDQARGKRSQ